MRLSEAMRLGAMALPPVHGPIFGRSYDPHTRQCVPCGACALGAVLYAVGGYSENSITVEEAGALMARLWPWTSRLNVAFEIVERFELRRETREQIADWIATIEPSEGTPADAPVEAELART